MKKVIISLILASGLFGEWLKVDKVDDFTDEKTTYATYSTEKHKIQISKEKNNGVWFYIKRKQIGHFEPNSIIELRVDKQDTKVIKPTLINKAAKLIGSPPMYVWEPDIVGFKIWHGEEKRGCGFIGDILIGKELKIRYRTSKFEKENFTVSLDGAGDIIKEILEIKTCDNKERLPSGWKNLTKKEKQTECIKIFGSWKFGNNNEITCGEIH